MQKKIKIPKLSLNHVEEAGEVTDYGEEDVELRHSKVLKSFLFFLFLPLPPFFFFPFWSSWGIHSCCSLRIPGLLLIPLKHCVCCNWVKLWVGGWDMGFQKTDSFANIFLFIRSVQLNCHLRFFGTILSLCPECFKNDQLHECWAACSGTCDLLCSACLELEGVLWDFPNTAVGEKTDWWDSIPPLFLPVAFLGPDDRNPLCNCIYFSISNDFFKSLPTFRITYCSVASCVLQMQEWY